MRRAHLHCVVVASLLGLSVGCTHTERAHVAVFEPAPGAISQRAPTSATYVVRYRLPGQDDFDSLDGTKIYVPRGTTLGFERVGGETYALAGPVKYTLAVPADATLKWWSRQKKPTQLAKNMQKLGEGFGKAALMTGIVVGGVALSATVLAIDGEINLGDCRPSH